MDQDLTFDNDLITDNKIDVYSIYIKTDNIMKNKITETGYNILMIGKHVNARRLNCTLISLAS